jgi:hypothetical protein
MLSLPLPPLPLLLLLPLQPKGERLLFFFGALRSVHLGFFFKRDPTVPDDSDAGRGND